MSRSDSVTRRRLLRDASPALAAGLVAAATQAQAQSGPAAAPGGRLATLPTLAALKANHDPDVEAVVVQGYHEPGDGGGGLYRRADDASAGRPGAILDRQDPKPQAWRLENFGAPLSAKACGAKGDGRADDTDALKDWLAALQGERRPGFLPSGRYRLREGELKWLIGRDHEPGPWIETAPGVTLLAAGLRDEPILEIRNSTPYRFAIGGWIGPLGFEDRRRDGVLNRHGLRLSGVQSLRFGHLSGQALNGDVVHCEKRDNAGDPDPYHVGLCTFEGVSSRNCAGWTFNNDNGVGFNACAIEALRNILGDKGAFRGAGAANRLERISVGSCAGWAIDLLRERGTVQRLHIGLCELDAPENGIRVSGLSHAAIERARIVHRQRMDSSGRKVYWPRTALSLGGPPRETSAGTPSTRQLRVDLTHRIEPAADAAREQLGVFFTANRDSSVSDVEVRHAIDNGNRELAVRDEDLFAEISPHSAVRVRNRERLIHDGYPRVSGAAFGATGMLIRAAGYGTSASRVAWPREMDGVRLPGRVAAGPSTPPTGEYDVPMDGLYRVRAQICLAKMPRARVRMAIMVTRQGPDGTRDFALGETYAVAAGPEPQTYAVACDQRFFRGDRIWISADQGSGADVAVEPGLNPAAANRFEVSLVSAA